MSIQYKHLPALKEVHFNSSLEKMLSFCVLHRATCLFELKVFNLVLDQVRKCFILQCCSPVAVLHDERSMCPDVRGSRIHVSLRH